LQVAASDEDYSVKTQIVEAKLRISAIAVMVIATTVFASDSIVLKDVAIFPVIFHILDATKCCFCH